MEAPNNGSGVPKGIAIAHEARVVMVAIAGSKSENIPKPNMMNDIWVDLLRVVCDRSWVALMMQKDKDENNVEGGVTYKLQHIAKARGPAPFWTWTNNKPTAAIIIIGSSTYHDLSCSVRAVLVDRLASTRKALFRTKGPHIHAWCTSLSPIRLKGSQI